MSIKEIIIDIMMRDRGVLFVDTLKSDRNSDIFYCVNTETKSYSFWRWKIWRRPVIISDNLSREDAEFELSIMGG